jgi:hypothetical protein
VSPKYSTTRCGTGGLVLLGLGVWFAFFAYKSKVGMVVGVFMVGLSRRCELGVVGAATRGVAWPILGAGVFTLGGDKWGCVIREGIELGASEGGIVAIWARLGGSVWDSCSACFCSGAAISPKMVARRASASC